MSDPDMRLDSKFGRQATRLCDIAYVRIDNRYGLSVGAPPTHATSGKD